MQKKTFALRSQNEAAHGPIHGAGRSKQCSGELFSGRDFCFPDAQKVWAAQSGKTGYGFAKNQLSEIKNSIAAFKQWSSIL
jgi:hypothetical protein